MPDGEISMDAEGLLDPAGLFDSFRLGGELLAVGALKQLDGRHAELKCMHTAATARGRGIGRAMAGHLIGVARDRGFCRVSLETGCAAWRSPRPVRSTRAQDSRRCEPFGDYRPTPSSTCMTLSL